MERARDAYYQAEALYRRLVAQHAAHEAVPRAQLGIGACLHSAEKYDAATGSARLRGETIRNEAEEPSPRPVRPWQEAQSRS